MDPDAELLAEVEQILDDQADLAALEQLVKMHAAVGNLLASLERRIDQLVSGEAV